MSATPAFASALFDDDSAIDITLSGPLGTISRERQDEIRVEYPFVLTIDGKEVPLGVRVRGHSRTYLCSFPPLRLRFEAGASDSTVFAGQDTLKLVTHCRNDKAHYEDNALDEYMAYHIFNLISDVGYRVRLLRIRYDDTDGKLKHLDRPYYGFVIEPDDELAARVGGNITETPGVLYSRLNAIQTARVNVFQYLIANMDWSLVTATGEDICCHNIDLMEIDDELFPIPYDFDLSGVVHAKYAKPPEEVRVRSVTTRVYRGYCRSPIEEVAAALDDIMDLRDEIMAIVEASPATNNKDAEKRTQFIGRFFEEAAEDREKLISKFDQDCIGGR